MREREFLPRVAVDGMFERWWMVILFMVAGGMLGWAIQFFQPPIYEASATITATMEFHKWNLNEQFRQVEEDHAFLAAEAIISSAWLKGLVLEEALARGWQTDLNEIQLKTYLERRQSKWQLMVRDQDPKFAAEIANIWAEKSLAQLDAALAHALRVDVLENEVNELARSRSNPVTSENYEVFQAEIQTRIFGIIQEKKASLGVISIMVFTPGEPALPPTEPRQFTGGSMVLAGAVIGFVVSLWAVNKIQVKKRG